MTVIRAYAEDVDDALVLIEGSQIRAVGPAEAIDLPADVTVVDLNGHYLIPGLIDAHVHFFQSGGLYTRPDVIDLRGVRDYSEELRQIRAGLSETFRRYLVSGVTSVVDMGGARLDVTVLETIATAATAIGNVGPAFGRFGPMGGYTSLSEFSKLFVVFLMWIGRLEIIPVLVLLTPEYWQR